MVIGEGLEGGFGAGAGEGDLVGVMARTLGVTLLNFFSFSFSFLFLFVFSFLISSSKRLIGLRRRWPRSRLSLISVTWMAMAPLARRFPCSFPIFFLLFLPFVSHAPRIDLGLQELREMFKRMNIRANEKELQTLFSDLDTNNDGEVSFPEFLGGIRWIQKGATLDWRISRVFDDSEDEDPQELDMKRHLDIYLHVSLRLPPFHIY